MAFKRIVANSEEDLKTIMSDIMKWFKETKDYKVSFSKEKRKFLDDKKNIVEKDIDVIKVVDGTNNKETSIKFVPMKEKGEMKVELGGEGETAIAGKLDNQMKGKGKLKSYSKDKKVALKEALDRRISSVFLKYRGKSFPMSYEPGSVFAKFVNDLEKSGYFYDEDEVSDFMASEEFDKYADKFNVEINYADYDPTPLTLAPEKELEPSDLTPGRASGDINYDMPHRVRDLYERLKKTGKIKKSELKEIIKEEIVNILNENKKFRDLEVGDKFLRFGENGQLWKKINNSQAEFITNMGKKTSPYEKKPGSLNVFPPTMDVTIYK